MAAANPAERLREEASCSICLDYFTDPVILDCGHNFCRSCIQSWERKDTNFPCPQCRKTFPHKNLRSNWQLKNVAEIAKDLSLTSLQLKEENVCEEHDEKLKLFCEEDQKMICVICRESQNHRSHTVIPIKEAAQEYEKKIKMHLEPLRKQMKDILKFKSTEKKKAEELRTKTKMQREKIVSLFEELQQFLNEKKQMFLLSLEEEEKKILQRISENVTQLEEQSSSLMQLISETEEKNQQPATELLKDVKIILSRCQKVKFPEPKAVSPDLEMGFLLNYPQQLKNMITEFKELQFKELDWYVGCGRYAVDVTLDPKTAHPGLIVFEDQKSVRWEEIKQDLLDNPERFDTNHCVLGCEGFNSGRHYWEVEVTLLSDWILGVCKDSVKRKGRITPSLDEGYWAVKLSGGGFKAPPGEGYWAMQLGNRGKYSALTSPITPLFLSEKPRALGILLDYEAGKVSFYNADNKSSLFTFRDSFTGKLRPFFSPGYTTLRIQPVAAWKRERQAWD